MDAAAFAAAVERGLASYLGLSAGPYGRLRAVGAVATATGGEMLVKAVVAAAPVDDPAAPAAPAVITAIERARRCRGPKACIAGPDWVGNAGAGLPLLRRVRPFAFLAVVLVPPPPPPLARIELLLQRRGRDKSGKGGSEGGGDLGQLPGDAMETATGIANDLVQVAQALPVRRRQPTLPCAPHAPQALSRQVRLATMARTGRRSPLHPLPLWLWKREGSGCQWPSALRAGLRPAGEGPGGFRWRRRLRSRSLTRRQLRPGDTLCGSASGGGGGHRVLGKLCGGTRKRAGSVGGDRGRSSSADGRRSRRHPDPRTESGVAQSGPGGRRSGRGLGRAYGKADCQPARRPPA